MMTDPVEPTLQEMFAARYSDAAQIACGGEAHPLVQSMARRGSCRAFEATVIPDALVDVLCAAALAAPTKSDLQQRDIVLLKSPKQREKLAALVSGQAWVADAPMIAVFCGNNRRQRLLHDWHGVPFANDHLDAFTNAVADAAIALGAFVTAVEALGLGCCPISAVRNKPQEVSDMLGLPPHVFPFAGLAFGVPSGPAHISKRLPLGVTVHVDAYQEDGLREAVEVYDQDRAASDPYGSQRFPELFGESETYCWSEDKVRQYSQPERAGFGAFVQARGFKLE